MNIRYLTHNEDVIDFIIDNIDLKKPNKHLIIFPGNRPKLFLLKRLSEKIKKPFEPPVVFSFENFIKYLAENDDTRPNIASDIEILYHLYHLNINNELYSKYKSHLSLFLPFSQKIIADYSLLLKGESITTLKVKKESILKKIDVSDLYKNVDEYIGIICALDDSLEKNGKISDSHLFRIASDLNEETFNKILSLYEKIFIVDIIPLFISESKLLNRLANLSNTTFIYQQSQYLNNFKYLHALPCNNIPESEFITKNLNVFESPDIHGQVLSLKKRIFENNSQKKFESPDTLIMLPENSTLKILTNLFLNELNEDEYNVSIGIPLSTMQMSKFFNIIFDIISESNDNPNDIKATHLLSLLSHEYSQSMRDNKNNNLFTIKEKLYDLLTNKVYEYISIGELEKLAGPNPLLSEYINLIIQESHKIKTIGDLSEYICNIITFIDKNQKGMLSYGYFNIEAAKIYQRFNEISQSLLKDINIIPIEFRSVFNNFIESVVVRPEGSPLFGLQVLGVYESRAIRFKNVYILDFNDESFFDYTFEDSFLPNIIRKELNLPSKSDYDNYILYFLDVLFSQSENIELFYIGSDRYSKHRYLLRHLYEKKKRDEPIDIITLYYNINLSKDNIQIIEKGKEEIDKILSQGISATKLNTYLNCPAQFYYESVLGLEEKEEVDDAAEGIIYGNILHTTFEKYFKQYSGKASGPIDKRIYSYLKDSFREYIKYSSKKYLLDLAMLEVILDNFINQYNRYESLIKGKVLYLENRSEITVTINRQKIRLSGRFDRIDLINDSTIHIIDYKFANSSNYKIIS
ncbi:MAG: PD-(D/E)XK nuclease family protein, partial [Deltaproteobacteria bacterium]|nr:PD-(D/E)XK nuclease family protein [Deltaproteobacteria bacterium]